MENIPPPIPPSPGTPSEDLPSMPPMIPPTDEEKNYAMFAHLCFLIGHVVPFGNIIGPICILHMYKDKSAFVKDQATEALNFEISYFIYMIACVPLLFAFCIGLFLMIPIGIAALVFSILAMIDASQGKLYRYPFILRLVK
ncbi:MAG: DUF4870 domain-containing protein [Verrucomicrobiota bacterium]|nr:DUF4870 domain-containing protein [Verrucomicrobiota bacterium]